MNRNELAIGMLALELVPVFTGRNEESAKLFMEQLEEAFYLAKVTNDKCKNIYFRKKLQELPLLWYESLFNDYNWESLKKEFIQEFERKEVRLQYVSEMLMTIQQKVEEEENESVQSFSYRIIKLFNDYKQLAGTEVLNGKKVSYFINGLLPYYKLQLMNLYQEQVGVYADCLFEDVLQTALKLEANHKVFEEECKQLQESGLEEKIRININTVQYDRKIGDPNKSGKSNDGEENVSFHQEGVCFDDQLISTSSSVPEAFNDMLKKDEADDNLHYGSEGEQVGFVKVINGFETNYNINGEGAEEEDDFDVIYKTANQYRCLAIERAVNDRKDKLKLMELKENEGEIHIYYHYNWQEGALVGRMEPKPPWVETLSKV